MVGVEEVNPPPDVSHVPAESGLEHAVLERAVAVVVIQVRDVVAEVRLHDVEETVLVVIGDGDAHSALLLAVLVQGDPGQQTRLLEGAVAAVVIEQARRRVARDVEVGVAVAVEVGRDDAEPVAGRGLADAAGGG